MYTSTTAAKSSLMSPFRLDLQSNQSASCIVPWQSGLRGYQPFAVNAVLTRMACSARERLPSNSRRSLKLHATCWPGLIKQVHHCSLFLNIYMVHFFLQT
jgi:hypothetical protein